MDLRNGFHCYCEKLSTLTSRCSNRLAGSFSILNYLKLWGFFQFKQMRSGSIRYNLMMQLIYVIADCQKYALRKNIFFSTIQISSEVHVFFHVCEASLTPISGQISCNQANERLSLCKALIFKATPACDVSFFTKWVLFVL